MFEYLPQESSLPFSFLFTFSHPSRNPLFSALIVFVNECSSQTLRNHSYYESIADPCPRSSALSLTVANSQPATGLSLHLLHSPYSFPVPHGIRVEARPTTMVSLVLAGWHNFPILCFPYFATLHHPTLVGYTRVKFLQSGPYFLHSETCLRTLISDVYLLVTCQGYRIGFCCLSSSGFTRKCHYILSLFFNFMIDFSFYVPGVLPP